MFACVILALLLCGMQVMGSALPVMGCLMIYLLLVGWCCSNDFTLPVLLFFLPWSPILRLNPDSYSFYTFGMVLVCLISVAKKRLTFRAYQIKALVVLLFLTLLSKLLDGSGLSFDYIAFMMMIALFPMVREEAKGEKFDFYQLVVFFSVGIITAALCALFFAASSNIGRFIRVDSWSMVIRRSGFYGDANFYVAQVLAALAGTLSLILGDLKRSRVVWLCVAALFLLYCGFLSGSKSFALVAVIIILLWIVAIFRMRGRAGLKIVLLGFVICTAGFVATSMMFNGLIEVIVTRFSSAKDLNSLTTGRIALWESYIQEIVGNVKVFFLGRGFTDIKVNGLASHNTILQAFYQFGLLGVPVLVYWITCFFRSENPGNRSLKHPDLKIWMIGIGTFLPWMAIDIMFFDEFFLFQTYIYFAVRMAGSNHGQSASVRENNNQLGGRL